MDAQRRIKLVVAYDGTNYCGWQTQPNGVTIEEIGTYQPVTQTEGNQVTVNMERAKYWIANGAQPTDTVRGLLKKVEA